MKTPIKITLTAALLLSALLCQSCSGSLVNLTYKDGQLINKRLKLYYNAASTSYEPVSVGEAYGYYGEIDMTLYEITGLDPKEWLTQAYAGTATTIFYNEDIILPSLAEMDPNKMYVCLNEAITFAVATVEEEAVIDELINLFENGAEAEWPLIDSNVVYNLKFLSEENYPHIYYNLTYGEFEEGNFLYERSTKRCVEVGTLISDIIS